MRRICTANTEERHEDAFMCDHAHRAHFLINVNTARTLFMIKIDRHLTMVTAASLKSCLCSVTWRISAESEKVGIM